MDAHKLMSNIPGISKVLLEEMKKEEIEIDRKHRIGGPMVNHKPNKVTMTEIVPGLKVDIRTHETWLHFSSSKGRHCSFCIEGKFLPTCAKAITEWVQDRLKD